MGNFFCAIALILLFAYFQEVYKRRDYLHLGRMCLYWGPLFGVVFAFLRNPGSGDASLFLMRCVGMGMLVGVAAFTMFWFAAQPPSPAPARATKKPNPLWDKEIDGP